ncbi:NAD(P)/FAD-dependent oxidoreductase [Reyranella sp.]|uniref:NAD(P)/FAD-dependent oxidoreductase n=1 Tax=Reyranella sp. TaxID=1929291 RepID=UPI0037844793
MYLTMQDDGRLQRTVFSATAGSELGLSELSGRHVADIAIVGGGIGGCSAALHAAEGSSRVVLLEANRIGWGASGRNGGHVAPATKHDPDEVIARYGHEAGQRLIDAAEQGPSLVGDLVARHGIDCEYSVPGIISAAHTPAAMETLARRVDYWQSFGRPVELLDRRRAAEMIGSDYYLGAWLDRRGAKLNPMAYVRGLARAAVKAGASLYEGTRATRLERQGSRWKITTPNGEVEADMVFLCTNAYTDDLWPGLRQTFVPVRAFQFASRPLRDNIRKTILPGGQPMTDSRRLLSGVRLHSDGRLQFGGQGPAFGPQGEPAWRATLARLRSIFPQLGDFETDFWWTGFMAMNGDNSWHIHELGPGLLAMAGCNGRGVALATIYGREFARYAHGTPAREFVLPPTPPRRIFAHGLVRPFVSALIQYYAARDAIEVRRLERERPKPI